MRIKEGPVILVVRKARMECEVQNDIQFVHYPSRKVLTPTLDKLCLVREYCVYKLFKGACIGSRGRSRDVSFLEVWGYGIRKKSHTRKILLVSTSSNVLAASCYSRAWLRGVDLSVLHGANRLPKARLKATKDTFWHEKDVANKRFRGFQASQHLN